MIKFTYETAEQYIHSLTRFGSQLGLERMKRLLEVMGNPQNNLKFIHIAGTNGKGSTANLCSNILHEAGYKVGMYTSPFVDHFRERFQIDGKMITKADFIKATAKVKTFATALEDENMQITEFEAITAIAFEYFSQNKCDIVCLEVGLGGRFDATNIIGTPEVAIITSISMDHVAILGDSIEKIAFEKAGIIKEGTTVVTYPFQCDEALKVIADKCEQTNSKLVVPDLSKLYGVSVKPNETLFTYDEVIYKISLTGLHQVYNTIAVITAMKELCKKGFRLPSSAMLFGIFKTTPPARFERIGRHEPFIYLDGAHNIQAVTALATNIDLMGSKNVVAIMGMMADKDYESSVKEIASRCKAFIAVDVDNPRAAKRDLIAKVAQNYCNDVIDEESYVKAIQTAIKLAGADGIIIGCGSFYMVSDLKKAIKESSKIIL